MRTIGEYKVEGYVIAGQNHTFIFNSAIFAGSLPQRNNNDIYSATFGPSPAGLTEAVDDYNATVLVSAETSGIINQRY